MHRLPTRKQPRNHTRGTNDDPNSTIMKDEAAYESLLTQAVAIMVFHAMESRLSRGGIVAVYYTSLAASL